MPATFECDGVRFDYPENWIVEQDSPGDHWAVTVQSPQTAFMMISAHSLENSVEDVLETALSALREDYPDLESEPVTEKIARRQAPGLDVQFISLDFTNSCWIRCFTTSKHTVLVMCQASDFEVEELEPVLRAMRSSIQVL